jgi:hypothetical protein
MHHAFIFSESMGSWWTAAWYLPIEEGAILDWLKSRTDRTKVRAPAVQVVALLI